MFLEKNMKGESKMLKKLLVPTDGSDSAYKAIYYARDLLKHKIAEEVVILHVGPAIGENWGFYGLSKVDFELKYQCVLDDAGKRILRLAREPFEKEGLPVETVYLCGDLAETIVNYAEENDFKAIIIGNKGFSKIAELLLGSVCDRVIRLAKIPVMVIR